MNLYKTAFEIATDLAEEWLHLPEPTDEDVMDKIKFMRKHGVLEPDAIIRKARALHRFGRAILTMAMAPRKK